MGTESIKTAMQDKLFEPKTLLGCKLWEIRQKIVASGQPLLGWEEVEKEVSAEISAIAQLNKMHLY
ncbi:MULTISPECIES: hypothetical protein [Cyanophyceae]|uniref:hypothetical protein n=1 Tax=Cyanophyceae TaxID=3028117 RepID=UPI0016864DE2|nr:hypothetical protein [Trichocoleus sp. FACHB-69]MBD1932024.1 hypothetical protein [Trichocoleus sp. FACHB-69]